MEDTGQEVVDTCEPLHNSKNYLPHNLTFAFLKLQIGLQNWGGERTTLNVVKSLLKPQEN